MPAGSMTRSDDRSESQVRRRSRVASFRRGGTAMTAGSGIVPLRKEAITIDAVCGNAKDRPGRARGPANGMVNR